MLPPHGLKASAPAAGALALAALLTCAPALAQQKPMRITPPRAGEAQEKAGHEQELGRVRADQRKAAETEARLKAEIDAIGRDRKKLSQTLIDTAIRLREAEGRVAASETRLAVLAGQEQAVRKTLDGRRAVIAELLAALQRMGRRPPPALMVRPEDALGAVRSAIMLGAVLPEMRQETEALAADLAALVRLRQDIATEHGALAQDLASLAGEQSRMALLVEERQKRLTEVESALDEERQRAVKLARQAANLQELLGRLESNPVVRPAPPADGRGPAPPRDIPARLAPSVAFAAIRGALPFPVNGNLVREFGAADGVGGVQKGLTIATRASAQVTAPADGQVVYAGPFRSYGQLLILNVGGGYHMLLAGMERISVDLGQFVLAGEPVAVMGDGPKSAAAVGIGSRQPTLYIEFRKDGAPVDPGPWWAITDSEKVRG